WPCRSPRLIARTPRARWVTAARRFTAASDSPGNTTCSFITNEPNRLRLCSATPIITAKRLRGRSWTKRKVERNIVTIGPALASLFSGIMSPLSSFAGGAAQSDQIHSNFTGRQYDEKSTDYL